MTLVPEGAFVVKLRTFYNKGFENSQCLQPRVTIRSLTKQQIQLEMQYFFSLQQWMSVIGRIQLEILGRKLLGMRQKPKLPFKNSIKFSSA